MRDTPKSAEQTMADHSITRDEAERVVATVAEVDRAKADRRTPNPYTAAYTDDWARLAALADVDGGPDDRAAADRLHAELRRLAAEVTRLDTLGQQAIAAAEAEGRAVGELEAENAALRARVDELENFARQATLHGRWYRRTT